MESDVSRPGLVSNGDASALASADVSPALLIVSLLRVSPDRASLVAYRLVRSWVVLSRAVAARCGW